MNTIVNRKLKMVENKNSSMLEQDFLPHDSSKSDLQPSPEDKASLFSWALFWWVWPTIKHAADENRLNESELPRLPIRDRPNILLSKFRQRCRTASSAIRLFRHLLWAQPHVVVSGLLSGWVFLACMTADPIFLNQLLDTVQTNQECKLSFINLTLSPMALVVLLATLMIIRACAMELCWFFSVRCVNNMRTILVNGIFLYSMSDKKHKVKKTHGELGNLMSTDADTIGQAHWMLWAIAQWTWSVFSIPLILYELYALVDAGAYIAVGVLLGGVVIMNFMGGLIYPYMKKMQECRDERSQKMNVVAPSMKAVKLTTMEGYWSQIVTAIRDRELKRLRVKLYLDAFATGLNMFTSFCVPFSIFAYWTWWEGNNLDVATAFTSLAWINNLTWMMCSFPQIATFIGEIMPCLQRLSDILPEIEKSINDDAFVRAPSVPERYFPPSDVAKGMVSVRNLTLGCKTEEGVMDSVSSSASLKALGSDVVKILSIPKLDIEQGKLVLVAGTVGSGKTVFLEALAGCRELTLQRGELAVRGSRAFVSQIPFLINDTVEENVRFAHEAYTNSISYDDALKKAQLSLDLTALPNGDQTMVGEAGVQLSGGQRVRIGFARALYSDADVYILDDLLSAVDAHVAKKMWETVCELKRKGKTIIVATHQVDLFSDPNVSEVLFLGEGKVLAQGPWREISNNPEVQVLASHMKKDNKDEEINKGPSSPKVKGKAPLPDILDDESSVDTEITEDIDETNQVGSNISFDDVQYYVKCFSDANGQQYVLVALLVCIVGTAVASASGNVWLSVWTAHHHDQLWYLDIYLCFGILGGVLAMSQAILLAICSLRASREIHTNMLSSWLRAPMVFFDNTPTGRHLNRFLRDIKAIDQEVPPVLLTISTSLLNITVQFMILVISAPLVICALPLMSIPNYYVVKYVRAPCRDSRRYEAVARTPVYGFFADVLVGRKTIRAYGVEKKFCKIFEDKTIKMATAKYGNEGIQKWAQALLTVCGALLYFVCGIVGVFCWEAGTMTASTLGMVLTFATQLQRALSDCCMQMTTLEAELVAIERCVEYATHSSWTPEVMGNVNQQAILSNEANVNNKNGSAITLRDLQFRYSPSKPMVIKGLTASIPSGQKVAIVGRTGCGKSSLFQVLSGLYPYNSGKVQIDGQMLETIPLYTLRSAIMRSVTQGAFAISTGSTLREVLGLGKNKEHDKAVLNLLKQFGMEHIDLDAAVTGTGAAQSDVFSSGERQLIALIQGIVGTHESIPTAKVYLFDEVTASVDMSRDEAVNNLLANLPATVIAIMHRLQHLPKFDMVIVMDEGQILEMGPPQVQMKPQQSFCSKTAISFLQPL